MSLLKTSVPVLRQFLRQKSSRRNLGKPPGVAKDLNQKLAELQYVDPEVHYRVNIGFKVPSQKRKDDMKERISLLKENRTNPNLEKQSRSNQLLIPLNEVEEEWANTPIGYRHIQDAADHYGVYTHLFRDAFFTPVVNLKIDYKDEKGNLCPVYRGNIISPSEAIQRPQVSYPSKGDSLWTLALTTPDGHLSSAEKEYVLWLKGNIRGNDLSSGDELFSYLQPFPLKGIGYCRYVFVLYRQESIIDYSSISCPSKQCKDPQERDFSTLEFYKAKQDLLTPAGIAFYQSTWDSSVTDLFHKQFNRAVPEFCYDFPPHYYTPQKWFPKKQPFNLYLDRYREEKDIAQEWLKKKLKKYHPFKGMPAPLKYPMAVPIPSSVPSWLKNEIKKERLGWGRVNDY